MTISAKSSTLTSELNSISLLLYYKVTLHLKGINRKFAGMKICNRKTDFPLSAKKALLAFQGSWVEIKTTCCSNKEK
jgi:hypothetical protein